MIPSNKKRDHSWKKFVELEKEYSLEHLDGNVYKKLFRAVSSTEDDAALCGFICFCSSLAQDGVHVPRTLRREYDSGNGEGEST